MNLYIDPDKRKLLIISDCSNIDFAIGVISLPKFEIKKSTFYRGQTKDGYAVLEITRKTLDPLLQ